MPKKTAGTSATVEAGGKTRGGEAGLGPALHDTEALTGHLDGIDEEGRLLFRVEGEDRSVPVSIGVDLPDDTLVQAAVVGRRGLVIRTSEARPRLVLIGLVRERVSSRARDRGGLEIQAKLDGETVQLSARKEIELKCGKARITLHESGRIEVSGTYILNRSRGPVKLKGATVEIN